MPTCPACGVERPPSGFCPGCGAALVAAPQHLPGAPPVPRVPPVAEQLPGAPPPRSVPDDSYCASHPATEAAITCSRCGAFTCEACAAAAGGTGLCPGCQALVAAPYVPWEHRREVGLLRAFWQTSKGLTLSPREAWERIPRAGNAWDETSFLFAASYAEQSGITLLSAGMNLFGGLAALAGDSGNEGMSAPVMLIVMPLYAIGSYLIFTPVQAIFTAALGAGLEHLVLLALGAAGGGFGGTYRAYCYGKAPGILGVVPFCGTFAAIFGEMYVRALGYMHIHRTTGTKAALAVVLPMVLCLGAAGALLLLVFGFIAASGGMDG